MIFGTTMPGKWVVIWSILMDKTHTYKTYNYSFSIAGRHHIVWAVSIYCLVASVNTSNKSAKGPYLSWWEMWYTNM